MEQLPAHHIKKLRNNLFIYYSFDHEADGDSKKARLGTSVQVWWFRIAAMADVEIYSFMSIEAGKGYFTLCLLMCK